MLNRILVEGDPNERVFAMLESVLKRNFDIESVNRFRVIFLKEMGFLNVFSKCIVCGNEKDLTYMDVSHFALLCKNCYSNVRNFHELGRSSICKRFFLLRPWIYM
jgi:DNA repair protein RecO